MKSLLASVRAVGGLDRVDHAVQLLEDEWRTARRCPAGALLDGAEARPRVGRRSNRSVLLAELIKTDLRCRFARGQTPDGRRIIWSGSRSSGPPTAAS